MNKNKLKKFKPVSIKYLYTSVIDKKISTDLYLNLGCKMIHNTKNAKKDEKPSFFMRIFLHIVYIAQPFWYMNCKH